MFPHPILATEDDGDWVRNSITELPENVEDFFAAIRAMADADTADTRAYVNSTHFELVRRLETLATVPPSAFVDKNTGVPNAAFAALAEKLCYLFRSEIIRVSSEALSWHRPVQQLADDLCSRLPDISIVFPWPRRAQRALTTNETPYSFVLLIVFFVSLLCGAALLLLFPLVNVPAEIGVALGIAAAVSSLLSGALLAYAYLSATNSLDQLYTARTLDRAVERVVNAGGPATTAAKPAESTVAKRQQAMEVSSNSSRGAVARNKVETGFVDGHFTFRFGGALAYIEGKDINAQCIMIGFDAAYRINVWNSAAEIATGFIEAACIGKPVDELIDCPGAQLVAELEQLKKSPGQQLRLQLRGFATSHVSIHTICAPVRSPDGRVLSHVLVCTNVRDSLKEARAYISDFRSLQITRLVIAVQSAMADARAGGGNPGDADAVLATLRQFLRMSSSPALEAYARAMAREWQWTTGRQLLSTSLGSHLAKCVSAKEANLPPTICVSTKISELITALAERAPAKFEVRLSVSTDKAAALDVGVRIVEGDKGYSAAALDGLVPLLDECCAYIRPASHHMSVDLIAPCQVSLMDEDVSDASFAASSRKSGGIDITIRVATVISNTVDLHNLSMALLKSMSVSLTTARELREIEGKLRDGVLDVVMADKENYVLAKTAMEGRRLLLVLVQGGGGGGPGAVMSPAADVDPRGDFFVLPSIDVRQVDQLMHKLVQRVAAVKKAEEEAQQREKILAMRQDSPWTQGRMLGRGSFGAVYEAHFELTGAKMAVKMFYFKNDGNEGVVNMLLNEVKVMSELNHPNIVHYFYSERSGSGVNLFMELCDCSLSDFMQRVKPRTGGATTVAVGNNNNGNASATSGATAADRLKPTSILRQMLAAVAYLHSRGIAHRDLKPQNILLKGDVIKVTDFGTAVIGKMTGTHGTFRYMAPEVYRGDPHSLSCDIWSVGCIAAELVGWIPQFMTNHTLLGELQKVEVPLAIPNPQRDFIVQCLQVNPDLRPTADVLLLHPLFSDGADDVSYMFHESRKSRIGSVHSRQTSAFSFSSNM